MRCQPPPYVLGLSGFAAACFLVTGPAQATDTTWVPAGGGDFLTAANWDTAAVPAAGDVALFDNEATGTINLTADHAVDQLNFRNDSGALTFDLGGNTLSPLINGGIRMTTGAAETNDVTFTNGTVDSGATTVLLWSGANATNHTLTFTGPNTLHTGTSTGTSTIATGAGATGNTLNILNGATFEAKNNFLLGPAGPADSSNAVNIVDSTFTIIENATRGFRLQSGTVNITNSDVLSVSFGEATDGLADAASGTVNFNSGTLSARFFRSTGGASGNVFTIGDGGSTPADFRMILGSPQLRSLAGVAVSSNGSIGGSGTITGDVSGDAGAQLIVSPDAAPAGTATTTINGDFDASNFDILLSLGDFPTELADDIANSEPFNPPFDQVLVSGQLTQPASVLIDLADYVAPEDMPYELKVLGWGTTAGSQLAPTFVNGAAMDFEYRADGLYLTTVPEPASLFLMASGGLLMGTRRRR